MDMIRMEIWFEVDFKVLNYIFRITLYRVLQVSKGLHAAMA